MKQLWKIECLRLLKNKISLISLCILILWMIVIITSSLFQESVIYDMNSKRLNGMDAIALEKELFPQDEIIIQEDITALIAPYQEIGNHTLTEEEANQIVFSKAFFPYQQLTFFLNRVYAPSTTPNTNTAIFNIDHTTNFYTDWKTSTIEELKKQDVLHQKNLDALQAIEPFSYSYAKGWEILFNKLPEFILGILICLALTFANIFSENYELKTNDIIQLTQKGKSELARAKLISVFLYATLLYFTFITIFTIVMLSILGSGGHLTSIQVLLDPFYPQNMTMLDAVWKLITLGYLAVLATSSCFVFVSSLCKSAFKTSIVSILLIFVPFYLSALSSPSIPLRLLPINFINEINVFNTDFMQILGVEVSIPSILFLESIFLLVFISFFVIWKEKHNRR